MSHVPCHSFLPGRRAAHPGRFYQRKCLDLPGFRRSCLGARWHCTRCPGVQALMGITRPLPATLGFHQHRQPSGMDTSKGCLVSGNQDGARNNRSWDEEPGALGITDPRTLPTHSRAPLNCSMRKRGTGRNLLNLVSQYLRFRQNPEKERELSIIITKRLETTTLDPGD